MVTSRNEWKILEWDENSKQTNFMEGPIFKNNWIIEKIPWNSVKSFLKIYNWYLSGNISVICKFHGTIYNSNNFSCVSLWSTCQTSVVCIYYLKFVSFNQLYINIPFYIWYLTKLSGARIKQIKNICFFPSLSMHFLMFCIVLYLLKTLFFCI